MQTTLAQAAGYSGSAHNGLNETAAYHRSVYENRNSLLSYRSLKELVETLYTDFQTSSNSRLVIRVLSNLNPEEREEFDHFIEAHHGSISWYPNLQPNTPQFSYYTISFNETERDLTRYSKDLLHTYNQTYISLLEQGIQQAGGFEAHTLTAIENFRNSGLYLTKHLEAHELMDLWEKPFGWSEEACYDLLNTDDGSFVMGVRNKVGEAVSVILFSDQSHTIVDENGNNYRVLHGETTEASTKNEYQGRGIMPILVAGLHSYVIQKGYHNIYGELRAKDVNGNSPNSINHGIKSGKVFHKNAHAHHALFNHVSIAGKSESYNIDRTITGYDSSPVEELRTFMVGAVDVNKFTPKMHHAFQSLYND